MLALLHDPDDDCWLRCTEAVAVIRAQTAAQVCAALAEIEARVSAEGLVAAGFLTYEAAPAFDPACETLPAGPLLPLLQFGLYRDVERLHELPAAAPPQPLAWDLDTHPRQHAIKVGRIHEEIARGNTYQVNYTMRALASGVQHPLGLFTGMGSDAPYAAYLETDSFAIASASPELFFRLDGEELVTRPMKGTAPRGLTCADDRERRQALRASDKDRAENVMIADMLRNDLGRIAEAGTVIAESVYDIEKYPTVWQATSTIAARTRASVPEIFRALFPCASITGAPKIASMKLIAELENSPRGIYTGVIGWLKPDRRAQFSVAIRTAAVDRQSGEASYGVGGGIVWDSDPASEYAEALAKGRILHAPPLPADLQLIETFRLDEDGYWLLERHLQRLQDSADYFDIPLDLHRVRYALEAARSKAGSAARVRLRLDRRGRVHTDLDKLPPSPSSPPLVRLVTRPVRRDDLFLYHKTTCRRVYDEARRADCDDVLLWNEDGWLTESTIANLVVEIDGQRRTPPVACGLLAGVARAELLDRGELVEHPVHRDELAAAESIYLLNSVRGLYRVRFVPDSG